jgi:hypothetical protein
MNKLNDAQRAFVNKYLEGLTGKKTVSAFEAYMYAYPESSKDAAYADASRLLKNTAVQYEIKQRLSEMAMSANEVLLRLASKARGSEDEKIQLQALELLGKTFGLFLDRTDITSKGDSISLADYLNGMTNAVKDKEKKNKYAGITVTTE